MTPLPTCPVCGNTFTPTSKHRRIYCDWVCLHTAARRRYRAKPEKKVMLAAYERMRRRKRALEPV